MDFLFDVTIIIDLKVKLKDIFLIPYGAVLSTMKH